MTLKDLSVRKFVKLYEIQRDADGYETEVDKEVALLSVLHDKPEEYYLGMTLKEFAKAKAGLNIISVDSVEPKPERYIKANGRVYAPLYDFKKLTGGQFVDATRFCKDPEAIIENLPKILASFCVPTKRTLFGRKKLPYMSVDHEDVARDMEEASIYDAYSIALFFWAVWKGSLEITGDYLVKTAIAKKAKTGTEFSKAEAAGLLSILEAYGDGITARKISR
jgi:hypothetical protein